MRVMLLAAGRGQRMRPLTDVTPKPLLKVAGRPLIEWHIRKLAQAGLQEFVVNHAWLGAQIEEFLGDGSRWGVRISHSAEPQALETAGGIANALPLLGPDPFLVINADVWSDWDPAGAKPMLATMNRHKNILAHLLLVPNPCHHPEGDFHLCKKGRLSVVGQQGSKKLTFSGIGVYRPELFSTIEPGQSQALAPLLRQAMACEQVLGLAYHGQWHDIGTVERLTELQRQLMRDRDVRPLPKSDQKENLE